MYEAFYQLREKPFSILPDPDLIYWGKMHSMAFTMLEFGVMNNAGFTVITGEIGSGKTTLVRHLLKKVSPAITIGLIELPTGSAGIAAMDPDVARAIVRWRLSKSFQEVAGFSVWPVCQRKTNHIDHRRSAES